VDLLSRLLAAMQELARGGDAGRQSRREAFAQIRSALTAGDCGAFRAALAEMDESVAATIKRRIAQSPGLSDSSRDKLLAAMRNVFYKLFIQVRPDAWADESVLWTTDRSLHEQEGILKDLLEVTMPANSKAIGEAAQRGDLSENSEWQYAIEEQRRLQARVAKMRDDLAKARIIRSEDVPTEMVGVGSRVVLRRRDGHEVELTFLGPWDTNTSERVFNYKTPLAQLLMGKAVGQTVTLKLDDALGEYVIADVRSAL
jgi:transcription elongation factor GreA